MIDNKKDFKDFISIDKFCEIVKNIIKKDLKEYLMFLLEKKYTLMIY